MRLVKEHLPNVPVPQVYGSLYKFEDGVAYYGELEMEFMPGRTLKSVWAELDEDTKDRICYDIWDLVTKIRAMPRPHDLAPGLYRTIDGSPFRDPLIASGDTKPPLILDDDTLRECIYAAYVDNHGLTYRDSGDLPESLPRSSTSVFTRGDIAPRNIIVDENCRITALLDWEGAGWFPDYWEYTQMLKFCGPLEHEWQRWMTKTKPEPWDISGIMKTRRVLF